MWHNLAPCTLTFDDGPDPCWTARILDCLRDERTPATFFVIAPRAERHPELIEQMVRDGHDVQLHCDRHARHTDMSEAALRRDVSRALNRLARLGVEPRRWRAPWGVCTPATHRIAAERRLTLTGWDVDTEDWRGDSATAMHARVADSLQATSIVLMHDGIGPGAQRRDCRQTLDLIPLLLDTVRERGLQPTRARHHRTAGVR